MNICNLFREFFPILYMGRRFFGFWSDQEEYNYTLIIWYEKTFILRLLQVGDLLSGFPENCKFLKMAILKILYLKYYVLES